MCLAAVASLLAGACGAGSESAPTPDRVVSTEGAAEPREPPEQESADLQRRDAGPEEPPAVEATDVSPSDVAESGSDAPEVTAAVEPLDEIVADGDATDDIAEVPEPDVADPEPPESGRDLAEVDPVVTDAEVAEAAEGPAAGVAEPDEERDPAADALTGGDGVEDAITDSDPEDEPLDQPGSSAPAEDPVFDTGAARSGETLVAASFDSTCAVRPDGDLWCWGRTGLPGPSDFPGFEDAVAVTIGDSSAGEFHACALHGDGGVSCWGMGLWGQLGQGNTRSSEVPLEVPGIFDAVGIAAGVAHTCAVHARGAVSCWGDGSQGQIGDGTTNSTTWTRRVESLSDVVAISAGSHTNCAIHADGTVSCWGWRAGVPQTTPRKVSGLDRVVSIAVGWLHSCAVRDDGRVFCWLHDHVEVPQEVPGLSGAVAVSVGDRSACAVHGDGGVSCWGENNTAGQLGDGTTIARATPERLAGISAAVAVTVSVQSEDGQAHACATQADGSVFCWGSNGFGQLGDGTTETRLVPTLARKPAPVVLDPPPEDAGESSAATEGAAEPVSVTEEPAVEVEPEPSEGARATGFPLLVEGPRSGDTLIAAARGRTCSVRPDGGVNCWGEDGLRERMSVAGLENVRMVSIADHQALGLHACALHRDGTVSCWGPGHEGSLGQGDTVSRYLPVTVPGITDAVAVGAGAYFTCAVHSDGGVSCWGSNAYGELGRGTGTSSHVPVRVPGLVDVVAIAAGPHTSCAIHGDGGVSCWGFGVGNTPSEVGALGSAVSISVGPVGACAATSDGHAYCWPLVSPVGSGLTRLGDIEDVVDVTVGDGSACTLHGDGGVSCWGENDVGQLGNGTTTPQSRPARLPGISDAVAVSLSFGSSTVGAHACALYENGSASCWGGNNLGQVGDGTYENALTPRPVMRFDRVPASQMPRDQTALLRTWIELEVQQREAEFPWLRVAWDHIRDRAVAAPAGTFGATVSISCFAAAGSFGCRAERMTVSDMEFGGIVHELAHVYDLTSGLAPRRAWGAVQLYFAATYPGCYPPGIEGEILADTIKHLLVPSGWLTYYESDVCPNLPPEPSREAEEVVLAGLAGDVPGWYSQNIPNGIELWEAWRQAPSLVALANLSSEFGGLCSTDWVTNPLDPARFPAEGTNPFRDGGC